MIDNNENPIEAGALQAIWDAHGLGRVEMIEAARRGSNNQATVVNDKYVIRFDLLDLPGTCRYLGEQLAYERLREAGIPAPEVVALDVSKAIIPYHYMILTKIEGRPLIDDWTDFSEAQRSEAGQAAGRYLAMMHDIRLEGFGKLPDGSMLRWYDYVDEYFKREAGVLLTHKLLDTQVYQRMRDCVTRLCPTLEMPESSGRLVHSDYQFENLLHRDGVVTGIIDFEWAVSGDPMWDFKVEDQWDDDCPGSASHIYEGYAQVRLLAPDHALRVRLYKLLFYLSLCADSPVRDDDYAFYEREMMKALAALEAQ